MNDEEKPVEENVEEKTMNKGVFISLEGIDGSGKSTQRELIVDWFTEHKIPVVTTREPGGTEMAEEIRDVLLRHRHEPVLARAEVMLFYAARIQHVENVIKPALAAGKVVVTDRFAASTYAYQAAGNDIEPFAIDPVHRFALGDFAPDYTFLYRIAPKEAIARALARGQSNRLDEVGEKFYEKADAAYTRMLMREKTGTRWLELDAAQPIEQVFAQALPTLFTITNTIKQRAAHR